ncbi:ABC transporter ATP-binding protein [Chloroflexota bacterium]
MTHPPDPLPLGIGEGKGVYLFRGAAPLSGSLPSYQTVHNIALSVKAGEMVGLLGPNGSGKTTLIKLASGILKPAQGEIGLDGCSLSRLSRKSIARSVAVVPQQFHIPFAFTVSEVVMLGRIPFLKPFVEESELDRRCATDALELVGIGELRERRFDELSGGGRRLFWLWHWLNSLSYCCLMSR